MNKSLLQSEALLIAAFLSEKLDAFVEHVAEHRDPDVYDDYENADQDRSYAELLISALTETFDGSKAINATDKPWTHDKDSAQLIVYVEVYGTEANPEEGSGRIVRRMLPPNFDTNSFDEAAHKLAKTYLEDIQMSGRPEITGGLVNQSYFREHYSHLLRFEKEEEPDYAELAKHVFDILADARTDEDLADIEDWLRSECSMPFDDMDEVALGYEWDRELPSTR